jgi:NADH dehydrogenase
VEDVAELAVEGVYRTDNYVIDAVGPDIFTFKEMVELIGEKIGAKRPLIAVPPTLALLAAQFISLFVRDVILTREEVDGLMADLLISKEPPRGEIHLAEWLEKNRAKVGARYASEIKQHYETRAPSGLPHRAR